MEDDRGLVTATLNPDEGAGVLADLATTVFEGADDEELVRGIAVDHDAHHKQHELCPWLLLAIFIERLGVLNGVAPVLLDDKVGEQGQSVAILDLATNDVV